VSLLGGVLIFGWLTAVLGVVAGLDTDFVLDVYAML
jgi:hypothetical protein